MKESKSESVKAKTRTCVKSRKQLASDYGVSIRTLYRWIKKEGVSLPPGLIKPATLKLIYKKFGNPNEFN